MYRDSKEMFIFLVRMSWEGVFKYFIFSTSQMLGMVEVQITSDFGGVQRKIRKWILM